MGSQHKPEYDPRGLIAESFAMDNIDDATARSIFLDWAMMDAPDPAAPAIEDLLARHQSTYPNHPMTRILEQGLQTAELKTQRRGRRRK